MYTCITINYPGLREVCRKRGEAAGTGAERGLPNRHVGTQAQFIVLVVV